jgi:hypothetical protein
VIYDTLEYQKKKEKKTGTSSGHGRRRKRIKKIGELSRV